MIQLVSASHVLGSSGSRQLVLENSRKPSKVVQKKEVNFCTHKHHTITYYISALQECININALPLGKTVHAHILKHVAEPNIYLATVLMNMYVKCGNPVNAHNLFNNIPERNVVSWTTLISGYAEYGDVNRAINFLQFMQLDGVMPNTVTSTCILSACADAASLQHGKWVHAYILTTGIDIDVPVSNALVDMYAKCGSIRMATYVFEYVVQPNVVSWTAMIAGHVQHQDYKQALELFFLMQAGGTKPNEFTYVMILTASSGLGLGRWIHAHIIRMETKINQFVASALVDMYGKCGSVEDAHQIFEEPSTRDVVLWTALIRAYAQAGDGDGAIKLFWKMQRSHVKPDKVTFSSIISACANVAALEKGKEVHAWVAKFGGDLNVFVGSALIDMYAKCGCIGYACKLFSQMAKQDVTLWNTVISGCAQHGNAKDAIVFFMDMLRAGFNPDELTFISVLSACSHVSLLDEGHHYFHSICENHGITVVAEHYVCIIDLLGRAGHINEAEDLIKALPIRSNVNMWMAFLGACRTFGHLELGKNAMAHAFTLEPWNVAAPVLLSNIYATAGKWGGKARLRELIGEYETDCLLSISCLVDSLEEECFCRES